MIRIFFSAVKRKQMNIIFFSQKNFRTIFIIGFFFILFFISGQVSFAQAATNIYYSVGQDTSDHKTGTPTLTISSGTGTFSVAQTASNMGIGDQVTYNTTLVAYVSGKISTTQWSLVTAIGTPAANVTNATVNSISHAYSSLEMAVTTASNSSHLNTTDLIAGNYILNIPCYYDSGLDTTAVSVTGWNTDANNYIRIYTPFNTATEVNQTQRQAGKWDDNKYQLAVNAYDALYSDIDMIKIDGLQIWDQYATWSTNAIDLHGGSGEVSNSILRGPTSANPGPWVEGLEIYSSGTFKIWNNIMYDFGYGIDEDTGPTAYFYNNTFYGNWDAGLCAEDGVLTAKNNISYNIGNSRGDYRDPVNLSVAENNLSYDASSPNSSLQNKSLSFVDSANDDFHLAAGDLNAIGAGENLSSDSYLPFSTDIDGQDRGSSWDVGADEYQGSRGGSNSGDIRSQELYVYDSNTSITSITPVSQDFSVFIGDNISTIASPVKSAYFKVSGTYTGGGTLNLTLNSGNSKTFILPSVSYPTFFEFFYADNSSIINPTSAGTYNYNFGLIPSAGITVYGPSVNLELTYQYAPASCADGSGQKVKTADFYIFDSNTAIAPLSYIGQNFSVYIGDNISTVSNPIKSAYFKVSGTYTGAGSITLTLNGSNSQGFTLPSVSNPTYFELLYADNSAIISPSTPGNYTYNFGITTAGVTIYGASATLEITYQYITPTCNSLPPTGELTSVIFDTTQTDTIKPAYNSIMWEGTFGGGNGRVRFQLATSDNTAGPWNFFGSSDNGITCNSGSWYDPSATNTPIEISCSPADHNNQRYYRYKVQLCSNNDCLTSGTISPQVSDVIVNWAP
jgi:hypothetical protein